MTSCLEGITRASIIELAGEIGVPVIERRITRDEVYCADEAFFTGTAAEVTPIRELDNRRIGSGERGRSPRGCKPCFSTALTARPRNMPSWLTHV